MISESTISVSQTSPPNSASEPKPPEQALVSRRRRLVSRLFGGLAVIAAIGLAAMWLFPELLGRQDQRATLPASHQTEQASTAVYVTTGVVQTRPVQRAIQVVGTLYGYEEVVISATVEGRVARLMADVANRVPADAQLAEIDPTNYEMAVRQAQRALEVELARLGLDAIPPKDFSVDKLPMIREAQSRLQFARVTEERTRQLSRSQAVAAQELESATADLQSAQAAYDNQLLQAQSAIASLHLRAEDLDIARQQLRDTVIRAPIPENPLPFVSDSAIYAVAVRNVSEGTFARVGSEVFRLVIDHALRLRVSVPERHLSEIAIDQNAQVSTSAYAQPFIGKVSRINPVIDASTRTFEVEILIDNSAHRLKPGGFAKARIITSENDTAVTVPLESVVTFAGITKLFLVENNQAVEVQVKLGQQDLDWVEIVSPTIEAGATIVTSGQSALSQGTAVIKRTGSPVE